MTKSLTNCVPQWLRNSTVKINELGPNTSENERKLGGLTPGKKVS